MTAEELVAALMPNQKRRRLLKLGEVDMISLVGRGDNPEARVLIHKAAAAPQREVKLSTKDEVFGAIQALAKALHPDEPEAVAVSKALESPLGAELYTLHCALEGNERTGQAVGKVAANLALDTFAVAIQKADPGLTDEMAFSKALEEHPQLAAIAVG